MFRKLVGQLARGQNHGRAGILEHEGQSFGRIGGIQRQIRPTGFEEYRAVHATISDERSTHSPTIMSGLTPRPRQPLSDPVGAPVQFRIGGAAAAGDHSKRIRPACDLLLEHLVDACGFGREARLSGVPRHKDLLPLALAQQRQLADALRRISDDAGQERLQMPRHPPDRRRLEPFGAVFQRGGQPLVRFFGDVQREIELGPFDGHRLNGNRQAGKDRRRCGGAQDEHDLEQGCWPGRCTGCNASTTRSNGTSACAKASRATCCTCASRSLKRGFAERSARRANVLRKQPINPANSARRRSAAGTPTTISPCPV